MSFAIAYTNEIEERIPASLNHVNQLVCSAIVLENDIGVVNLVLSQDGLHRLQIELRRLNSVREVDTALVL